MVSHGKTNYSFEVYTYLKNTQEAMLYLCLSPDHYVVF